MKKNILFFALGAIVFSGITGAIAYSISSKDIAYNNTNSGSEKTNVQDAIDDLYEIAGKNANNYSQSWFPDGMPLLPPLDASNYADYITVESYSTANLHNGNEVWGPFSNKNVYSYYSAGQSGIDYIVKIKNPVYADRLICQAGGWTGGYSNYTVYYLDKNNTWKQIYTSGNTTDYNSRTINLEDTVYGIRISGYHYYPDYNTYYPFCIHKLQLVKNWE